jgi:hypothetical protein
VRARLNIHECLGSIFRRKRPYTLGWIDFFEKCEFRPEDFKNRMGIAKNLQNENTRPINSVDLAYMQ